MNAMTRTGVIGGGISLAVLGVSLSLPLLLGGRASWAEAALGIIPGAMGVLVFGLLLVLGLSSSGKDNPPSRFVKHRSKRLLILGIVVGTLGIGSLLLGGISVMNCQRNLRYSRSYLVRTSVELEELKRQPRTPANMSKLRDLELNYQMASYGMYADESNHTVAVVILIGGFLLALGGAALLLLHFRNTA